MDSSAIATSSVPGAHDGMEFDSHEAAYSYYKEYAKTMGFGTSKLSSRRSRASKEFIDAKFSCIRYGSKQQSDDAINPRPSPKIGCKASMHVKRMQNGKWYIYSFVKEHNHELLPAQAHFFRSHRDSDPHKNDVRLRKHKILDAGSKQMSAYQNVDFLDTFLRSQHDKGRSLSLEAGDAQLLLELFMHMQEEDPKFFYAVDLNEEHKLRTVFWVDAKGMDDYTHFGDVVSFDTTYFTNKYRMPLVLFVGVNHHIQPTLLGCGLIADENVYTLVWLMQTWVVSMGGKAPRVILTDQNNAIKAAIGSVFPGTQHYYSLWNVLEKIHRKLDYLSLWQDDFMAKLYKCIYRSWTEEQFEKRWWKLVERSNLQEDEWFLSLYKDRRLWVPSFVRNTSFAGLSTASRSECLNSWFDKYIHGETALRIFVENYKLVLEDRNEDEAKANFDAWHGTPELKSPSPFEKQVLSVYTHEIFKKFQVEVLGAAACHLKRENEDESTITYTVKDFEDNQDFMVQWSESASDIYCSCHSFEYKGYICRHAIVVLQMSGVFKIPIKYILKRWTNVALSRHSISERLDEVQSQVRRYNDLCRRAIILGEEGSLSQESYNIAQCMIKEALKQCASVKDSIEIDAASLPPVIPTICGTAEENQISTTITTNKFADPKLMIISNKALKRADAGVERGSNGKNANNKGKMSLEQGVSTFRTEDGFRQMGVSNLRSTLLRDVLPAHNMALPQLHSVVPTVFHNVGPSQVNGVPSVHLHEKHLPY